MIFGAFSLLVCVILIYVLLLFSLFSFSSTCTACMYSQPLTLPSEIITRCLVRFHDWLAHTYMSVWQNSLFFLFFSLFFAFLSAGWWPIWWLDFHPLELENRSLASYFLNMLLIISFTNFLASVLHVGFSCNFWRPVTFLGDFTGIHAALCVEQRVP